eukprot:10623729-Alexandrium_andersonii.AAC.1
MSASLVGSEMCIRDSRKARSMLDIVPVIPQPSEFRSLLRKQEPIARSGWVGSRGPVALASVARARKPPRSFASHLEWGW